jgi:hypothetical protein
MLHKRGRAWPVLPFPAPLRRQTYLWLHKEADRGLVIVSSRRQQRIWKLHQWAIIILGTVASTVAPSSLPYHQVQSRNVRFLSIVFSLHVLSDLVRFAGLSCSSASLESSACPTAARSCRLASRSYFPRYWAAGRMALGSAAESLHLDPSNARRQRDSVVVTSRDGTQSSAALCSRHGVDLHLESWMLAHFHNTDLDF